MSMRQELLLEALLLKTRYKNNDILAVANELSHYPDYESVSSLLQVLAKLDHAPKKDQTNQKKNSELLKLKQSNIKHYDLLTDFQTKLINREYLPESNDIRYFMQEIGLKSASSKRREHNIKQIINALAIIPYEQVKNLIEDQKPVSKKVNERSDFDVIADAILRSHTEERK